MCRMPPCTFGCSVFTRPSSISGNPVRSLISRTVRPASRNAFDVPPVETNSTPSAESLCANSTRPLLSVTESKARRTARRSLIYLDFIGNIGHDEHHLQNRSSFRSMLLRTPHKSVISTGATGLSTQSGETSFHILISSNSVHMHKCRFLHFGFAFGRNDG